MNKELELYIRLFGNEYGSLYYFLEQEFCDIQYSWNEINTLYTNADKVANLLNKVASDFFGHYQLLSIRDFVIRLDAITQPEFNGRSKEKRNATLFTLHNWITDKHKELALELNEILESIKKHSQNFKEWRNKVYAHYDFKSNVIKDGTSKLDTLYWNDISKSINQIDTYFNTIRKHFWPDTEFGKLEVNGSGSKALIAALINSIEYKKLKSNSKYLMG